MNARPGALSEPGALLGNKGASVADREFLFEYRFGGAEWGISIHAADASEAREKIKAVGLARYKGEVAATVYVRGGITLVERLLRWCYRTR